MLCKAAHLSKHHTLPYHTIPYHTMDPRKLGKKKGGSSASSGEHLTSVGDVIEALSQNDVLCGRGSGPNDHPGNVAFRQLILSRKAEYLSTSARAEKAKIASEIVAHVQKELDPSGRFLKKMGPAELLEKGFQEGQDVWVVVDQDTALEKAKQALRQNRDKPLVEEELKKKQAERHQEYAKLTEQATASLKSNSAETATTATTAGTGDSATRKSVASVASSLSSGVGGQAKRMKDHNMTSNGSPPQHEMDPYATSVGDPLAPYPFDYVDTAAEHLGAETAHPGAPAHPGVAPYPNYGQPMLPSDDAYNNGQYAYHPNYGQQPAPPPPPPPPPQHQQHQYPQQKGGRAVRGNDDVTQSLRVSDLVDDFHRLGPGDGEAGGEQKTGGPVAREQFPYAFGEAGQGSSNVTMNSVFSAVSESDIIAANIDPIPVGGSEPAINGELPGPMSSGTIDLVQQLTQSSGEVPDGANNTNDQQQNSRQQSFQQQQYQRHPGHQPDRHSYVQQYYYRSSMAQQQQQSSMRGSLRNAAVFGSNRSDMRSDMTMSMSLTELMKEPSGRNIAAYRQSVAAGDKGMQGIAEGEADDEGSDNDEDGGASGEPMSGASAAAGSRSGSSSDKMSGMSSGSGMAASLASNSDNKPQALAVAPRPVELIQEEPDNLAFGASSSSMIKAVFDTSSGSNFSNLSRMSGILMSGDDELKPAAASDSEGKANT